MLLAVVVVVAVDLSRVFHVSCTQIASTAALLAVVVVVAADLSRVFHVIDSTALQATHRCTPAPHGMLALPAALPTHSFGDVDPEWMQIFGLHVRCGLVPQ